MTNIDICNMALTQLKNQGIRSFEDRTLQSSVAAMYYDMTRRSLLRAHAWNFARRDAKLSLLDVKCRDWRYVYVYPNDCLRLLVLYGGGQSPPVPEWTSSPCRGGYGQAMPAGGGGKRLYRQMLDYYDVFSPSPELTAIGCDVEGACLEYIYDARNTDEYPGDFVETLMYNLALVFAAPLSVGDSVISLMSGLYQNALARSTVGNKNENRERARFASAILAARNGGCHAGRI